MVIDAIILQDTSVDSLADRITEYLNRGFVRVGDLLVIPSEKGQCYNTGKVLFTHTFIQQMERRG